MIILGDFNLSDISWVSKHNHLYLKCNDLNRNAIVTEYLSISALYQYNGILSNQCKTLDFILSNTLSIYSHREIDSL